MIHKPSAAVDVEVGVPMTAPDGAVLRADVYHPRGATAAPVLLHRTPYGRHQANYREMAEAIASHGYVVVVQDLRGRFESDGEFVPMWIDGRLDGSDGARAVAWAQTLAGVRPDVGMYGVSYDASSQWETAALRPAGLRSVFPGGMMPDSRSVWPGVFRVGRQLKWALMLAADTRRRAGHRHPTTEPTRTRCGTRRRASGCGTYRWRGSRTSGWTAWRPTGRPGSIATARTGTASAGSGTHPGRGDRGGHGLA